MRQPLVSVIVTTKNVERFIERCLISIQHQTYKHLEIIIVDNNSTDNTVKIAQEYTSHVYIAGPERSAQRNKGADESKGEYLLFLDADMYLSKNVIKECVDIMINSDIKGIYIPEKILGDSYWSKVRNFERSFYDGTVIDAVRFVRKTDFEKIQGFDTELTGPEDWDFDKRIRRLGKTKVIKSSLSHDEQDFSLSRYVQKKSYYIADFDTYKKKWGNDPDLQMQFGFIYRYLNVFTEQGKWKRLISHPRLALGMYFLKFVVGLAYLKSQFR